MQKNLKSLFILLFLTVTLFSCGGGATTGTGTSFQGVIAFSATESGSITIDVPAGTLSRMSIRAIEEPTPINGECIFPGGTVGLTGGINPTTGAFTLTGGDYVFSGSITGGSFSGTVTNGSESGTFSGVDSSVDTVKVFCGTFTSDDEGVFLVVISGSTVTGSYAGTFDSGNLSGTLSGSTFTVEANNGGGATGVISGNSITGSVLDENGVANGTLSGSTAACSG